MKKLTIALSSLAALGAVSAVGVAQVATKSVSLAPTTSGTVTRGPVGVVETWVVGYPCDVSTNGDITTVRLTASSYCGGAEAGTFTMQRQYGVNIDTAQPQISYDIYPRIVDQLITSSWRRVGAQVTANAGYARVISFRAQ
jgi:hypothetical protein